LSADGVVKTWKNIPLTQFGDFSTMSAFLPRGYVFSDCREEVSRAKGGVERTSSAGAFSQIRLFTLSLFGFWVSGHHFSKEG
jgi:hypothetical protein